ELPAGAGGRPLDHRAEGVQVVGHRGGIGRRARAGRCLARLRNPPRGVRFTGHEAPPGLCAAVGNLPDPGTRTRSTSLSPPLTRVSILSNDPYLPRRASSASRLHGTAIAYPIGRRAALRAEDPRGPLPPPGLSSTPTSPRMWRSP